MTSAHSSPYNLRFKSSQYGPEEYLYVAPFYGPEGKEKVINFPQYSAEYPLDKNR
jgi:hypothetical protein